MKFQTAGHCGMGTLQTSAMIQYQASRAMSTRTPGITSTCYHDGQFLTSFVCFYDCAVTATWSLGYHGDLNATFAVGEIDEEPM